METYEQLYAKYGDWMSCANVAEALGRSPSNIDSHHWPLDGLRGQKLRGNGKQTRWYYSTYEIARKIEKRRQEEAEKKHYDKTLCKTCIYRDFLSGADRTLTCAYSAQPGHYTRTWHAQNDIPNAMDMAHCPFYIQGDQKPRPCMDIFPRYGGRRAFDT